MEKSENTKAEVQGSEIEDKVVYISRVAKVVKGGRRFSFSVLVVSGDHKGEVGYGLGKANEVPEAIRKAGEAARRNMKKISIYNNTIPFRTHGYYGAAKVLLMPAPEGTGVIAGGAVRSVLEVAGIENIRAKSHGTNNAHNSVKATIDALHSLKTPEEYAQMLGKDVSDVVW